VKRTSRDEPIGVVIHIHKEATQEDSLCSSLYQTSKNVMFLFLSFMGFVLQNRRIRGQNRLVGNEVDTSGKGEVVEKVLRE
jgi:hypothetical protein